MLLAYLLMLLVMLLDLPMIAAAVGGLGVGHVLVKRYERQRVGRSACAPLLNSVADDLTAGSPCCSGDV